MNFQPRNDGVLRQRSRVEQPGVGNDLLQLQKILLPELTPPELPQWLHPEKGEPHLLLQERLERRRDRHPPLGVRSQDLTDPGDVREIEKLEKPIDGTATFRCVV